jgi:hypothetical protein
MTSKTITSASTKPSSYIIYFVNYLHNNDLVYSNSLFIIDSNKNKERDIRDKIMPLQMYKLANFFFASLLKSINSFFLTNKILSLILHL